MNIYITLFLLFGACFGLATFSWRHLFSEGPRPLDGPARGADLAGRTMWMLICAFLWPIMVLSDLNTAWVLARRRQLKRQALAK